MKQQFSKTERKIKIYFLLQAKAFLPSWDSFLKACKNDPRISTKIIYCPPIKPKEGWSGQFDETEKWLKEKGFDYVHFNKINLLIDRPDVLFYQTPYDATHRNAKNNTDKMKLLGFNLAYISYGLEFTEARHNIWAHFEIPIHKNCWRIFSFCQNILEDYGKYCPIGNKHVRCVGHPKFDALYEAKNIKMPEWLRDKVNGRKIICWHPHFPFNYSTKDEENVILTFPWKENLKILEYIKNDKENFYIFMPHHIFFGAFEHDFGVTKEEIEQFKNQLNKGENSIIWEDEYPEVLQWSDMFMGERSAVTMEMTTTGKPVIYLENAPEIYNEFGKDVINSYYYASNAQEALDYLDKIKQGVDPKREERQKVFDKYFLPYWDGKCGERIKDEILKSKDELKTSILRIIFNYIKAFLILFSKIFVNLEIKTRPEVTHLHIVLFTFIKFKIKKEDRHE